jgi:hypothetical protein
VDRESGKLTLAGGNIVKKDFVHDEKIKTADQCFTLLRTYGKYGRKVEQTS